MERRSTHDSILYSRVPHAELVDGLRPNRFDPAIAKLYDDELSRIHEV
jgi:hypothetical protein